MQRKGFRWSVTTEPLKARSVYQLEITKLRAAQSRQEHFFSAVRAVVSEYDRMSFLLLPLTLKTLHLYNGCSFAK
jgi:hypothetical protein